MKKVLLIALMVVVYNNLLAFTTQGDWRWRKDDGSETTANWLAEENVAPVISSASDAIRLRISLFNNGGGDLTDAVFEYSTDSSTWITINLTATTEAFVLAGSSPNVTDLEATTKQLTGEGLVFVAGKIIVSSEKLPGATVGTGNETEYEYCIKPTANMLPNTKYYFRVNAAEYPAGSIPTLTTASVLPISLSSFTAKMEGKHVSLQWSTASEQNNSRFDVERSADGNSWKVIASVKGGGTTTDTRNYSAFDNSPLSGTAYYRITQYDVDGRSKSSEIKTLRSLVAALSGISVQPNPAHEAIRFTLKSNVDKAVAVLTNAGGKAVYTEKIQSLSAGTLYTLGLHQMPAPGIYTLSIKGSTINEVVRIMVR